MAIIPFQMRSRARRFEEAVRPHLTGLYRFAHRLTGSQVDAEDLVQDLLTRLYPRAEEVLAVERLGPWLKQVMYRQFIDTTRKKVRQAEKLASDMSPTESPEGFFETLVSGEKGPASNLDSTRLREAVGVVLSEMEPDERTLVLLHDVDQWKQDDIAEVLGVAVGTVKSRLHRVRARLRDRLMDVMEPFPDRSRLRE